MFHTFATDAHREMARAGYYTYESGARHPDRVLGVHDFFYVLGGQIQVNVGAEAIVVRSDDAAVLPAGVRHYGVEAGEVGTRCVFIHVHPRPGDRPGRCEPALTQASMPTLVHTARFPAIRHLFEQGVELITWPMTDSTPCFVSLFDTLVHLLDRAGRRAEEPFDDLVSRACMLISQQPSRFLSAEVLAQQLSTSASTLNRRFLAQVGLSVYQHQTQLRFERVKEDLTWHADLTLREIAANNGFSDEFHLSKSFKRWFGLSPSQYRKRQLSVTQD